MGPPAGRRRGPGRRVERRAAPAGAHRGCGQGVPPRSLRGRNRGGAGLRRRPGADRRGGRPDPPRGSPRSPSQHNMAIETALVLFNRDLRAHDNPALAAAAEAERTVPLFVFDERLLRSRFAAPNRVAFMIEALRDLDEALRKAGGRLFVRHGDPVREASGVARECGATRLHVSADWSAYAQAREERLARACAEERIEFNAHPGMTVVPPGAVTPAAGDHFKVFTPYHRAWSRLPRRELMPPPKLAVPAKLKAGR